MRLHGDGKRFLCRDQGIINALYRQGLRNGQ